MKLRGECSVSRGWPEWPPPGSFSPATSASARNSRRRRSGSVCRRGWRRPGKRPGTTATPRPLRTRRLSSAGGQPQLSQTPVGGIAM